MTEKIRCPYCDDELANNNSLYGHVQRFHTEGREKKLFKCPDEGCGKTFHKKKQLLAHVSQPSLTYKIHRCPHEGCGKTFTFPYRLKQHMKVHQGYPCDYEGCDEILPSWLSLRSHRAEKHAPLNVCDICGIIFKQKSNLTQHLKVHSETIEPLPCPHVGCYREFMYRKNLNQHIREFHNGHNIWRGRKRNPISRTKRKAPTKRSLVARMLGLDDRGKVLKQYGTSNKFLGQAETESTELLSLQNKPALARDNDGETSRIPDCHQLDGVTPELNGPSTSTCDDFAMTRSFSEPINPVCPLLNDNSKDGCNSQEKEDISEDEGAMCTLNEEETCFVKQEKDQVDIGTHIH